MTSKSPVRSAEDVDEQALSYAEIKALATGNPYIKEKMDLDVAVSKLKLLKQNHLSQQYALEDKLIKFYPQEIRRLKAAIEKAKTDIQTAKDKTLPNEDGFSSMTIQGLTFTEKKGAGSAILAECKVMISPDPKVIGSYRGFDMELSFNTFEKQYVLTLVGGLKYPVPLGTDAIGNITRIDNRIADIPNVLSDAEARLENTILQQKNAKEQVEKPFPQEEELKEKSKRLAEVNALLDMDRRDSEIVEGEPDRADSIPDRVKTDVVR